MRVSDTVEHERIDVSRAFAAAAERADPGLLGQVGSVLDHYVGAPPVDDADPVRGADEIGASGLNHDGTPLQLCLTLGASAHRWRAIVDPAVRHLRPSVRHDQARRALASDLASRGVDDQHFARLLAGAGPDNRVSLDRYRLGVFWVGVELGGSGRSVYVDCSVREPPDAWASVARTLVDLASAPGAIASMVAALAPLAVPVSVGLEVRGGHRRLKLHTRLTAPPPRHVLAGLLPMLAMPRVRSSIQTLMDRDSTLSLHGFVVEVAFDAATGEVADAKVDLAMGELWDRDEAFDRARRCADRLEVVWPAAIGGLRRHARLSHVGVGSGTRGSRRLNLYLKPDTS